MSTAFLGLGSNLGDRAENIYHAIDCLCRHSDIHIERISSLYQTSPMGVEDQPDFINAVVQIETELSPPDLLGVILGIEHDMGRVRELRWGPRIIDIDILLYDQVIVDSSNLTIPHPRMMERAFVMVPLVEIAPGLVLPNGQMTSDVLNSLGCQGVHKFIPET